APGAGVIHDIGYQTYEGQRFGRGQIALALCWHSLRSAFGFGRGAKAKIVPVLTFAIMCAPAVINAVIMALGQAHTRAIDYDTYVGNLRVLVLLGFMAAQAPELVSRDLRNHVLPLYFARPIRRQDYPLAKYAAFTLACLIMIDIPVLLLYIGTIMQVHSGASVWAETRALIPGLLVGLMWAAVLSAIALVTACVSGRRAFSTGSVAIFFFLTWTLANVLTKIGSASGGGAQPADHVSAATHLFGLISPFTVLDGVRQWLGGTNPGIVAAPASYGVAYGVMLLLFLGISLAALVRRYASVSVA
ncbi:MAG: ABC-2 transporter permease, partial [Nocardiopsaceae bacterium]|nr:ABC-2 transporter permease [Nocardiopsaceae bacterium]